MSCGSTRGPSFPSCCRWFVSMIKWVLFRCYRPAEGSLHILTPTCVSSQVEDVQYLLEVIWASRSVLNGSSDLYNLVFVRWDRRRDWSPWNCLLLSNEETSAHMELEDISKVGACQHSHSRHRRRPSAPVVESVVYLVVFPPGFNSSLFCSHLEIWSKRIFDTSICCSDLKKQPRISKNWETFQGPFTCFLPGVTRFYMLYLSSSLRTLENTCSRW